MSGGNHEELYRRGPYRLEWDRRTDGSLRSPYLQIVWYDEQSRRNRSRSTGTAEMQAAEESLDALYLQRERGVAICPTCKRPLDRATGHLVVTAIADYLAARTTRPSYPSIQARLGHVVTWLTETDQAGMTCEDLGGEEIEAFREWAIEVPITYPYAPAKPRTASTVEASVRQLAAAVNFAHARRDTLYPAAFKPLPPSAVDNSPVYRAGIAELAAMFRYCVRPPQMAQESDRAYRRRIAQREPLLRFLRLSVATWGRPEAVQEFSTDPERRQWIDDAQVVQLNPKGRVQNRKHRPAVPVGDRMAALIRSAPGGFYVGPESVRKACEAMLHELGLPRNRETGLRLIRRSVSTLARNRLGEERQAQWERMLGHRKASTSDLYALMQMGNLGHALAATNEIIEEIEALVPGAFTGPTPELKLLQGGKNG